MSFLGDLSVRATVDLAVRAEQLGVDSVWMSETYFERDAWTALAAIAASTHRVRVGSGVVPVFMRHPALLAMSFATLNELTGGRVVAGIGTGVGNVVSEQLSYDYRSPISAMREAITILRAMLAGDTVDVEGRIFSARRVELATVPASPKLPIHLAALGPKMCALAGELADGVHYDSPTPRLIADLNKQVDVGLERAGRTSSDFERVAWMICGVHDDEDIAHDIAREHIAVALSTALGEYQLEQEDLDPAIAVVLRQAIARGGLAEAVRHVPRELVDAFSVSGTPSQVIEKVEALFDAGINHPVLTAYGPFAAHVLPVAARFGSADGSSQRA
ncbi:LLM class flavin-dependent oxidoreductase [uncultured Jatrophihabitans sp.]|uniref:LLM class flavin-dependent oxidoreductase n=1 Tax=uncultured Jatrophihabitans sp. TaxID=1610747 RepID=UPI0035C9E0E2